MTGLFVFIIVVLIILALVIAAIRHFPNMDATVQGLLMVAAFLLAAAAIAYRAGVI